MTIVILITGAFLGFLASTGVPMHGGSGARVEQPTTLTQVQRTYETEFGTMTVDLRQVQFTPAPMSITASVAVGILRVDIPANAIVYLKTHIGAGTVTYDGRNGYQTPPFTPVPASLKTAAEQKRAPHIDLDVQVGAGQNHSLQRAVTQRACRYALLHFDDVGVVTGVCDRFRR